MTLTVKIESIHTQLGISHMFTFFDQDGDKHDEIESFSQPSINESVFAWIDRVLEDCEDMMDLKDTEFLLHLNSLDICTQL